MGFEDRTELAETVIETLRKDFWMRPPMSERVVLAPYGYETRIPKEAIDNLRYVRTETVKHVRFTPNFILIDKKSVEQTCLFEYKVTQTPLFSNGRIREIQVAAHKLDSRTIPTWKDIGQMEADAYDNYITLQKNMGVRVAILTYSAYHQRSLLCDFIENFKILRRDTVHGVTTTASRTPFVNFNYKDLRSLYYFILENFGITLDPPDHTKLIKGLCEKFPVTHHTSSPQHPKNNRKINQL